MKINRRPRPLLAIARALSIASFVALAISSGCTQDMVVGGALHQAQAGATGSTDGGTFACGSQTCTVGTEFCLTGPSNPGHCTLVPATCNGAASCGCVCETAGGGPGMCTDPGAFNEGLSQCSCQNVGATANVAVWCSLPNSTGGASGGNGTGGNGAGGTGGAGGASGTGGTSAGGTSGAGGSTFPCGNQFCTAGTEFCVIDPALAHCMALPTGCAAGSSGCECVCPTPNGGLGTCPNPGQFNEGQRTCSCQNYAATANAVISCH